MAQTVWILTVGDMCEPGTTLGVYANKPAALHDFVTRAAALTERATGDSRVTVDGDGRVRLEAGIGDYLELVPHQLRLRSSEPPADTADGRDAIHVMLTQAAIANAVAYPARTKGPRQEALRWLVTDGAGNEIDIVRAVSRQEAVEIARDDLHVAEPQVRQLADNERLAKVDPNTTPGLFY